MLNMKYHVKTFSFYLFLSFIAFTSVAADSLVLLKSVPVKARLVSSDPLGNIYVEKENNTLLRLNNKGDSIGIFNEIKKGNITQIDASNPLRILLFFADYNQVVVLNNMLTQKNIFKFNSIGLSNIACIANSADGNLWLYDAGSASLLKVDEQLNIVLTSNLRSVSENPVVPTDMLEEDRVLYITDTTEGVRKFDQFGFYNTTYHFNVSKMQVFNHYLVYFSSPYLYSYNLQSLVERKIELPASEDIIEVRVERDMLYILRKERLDMYSFSQ